MNKYKIEQEKKQALLTEHERQIKEVKERMQAEDDELSKGILESVSQIIGDAQSVLLSFLD